jgi:O-antigen biosynthesis protein
MLEEDSDGEVASRVSLAELKHLTFNHGELLMKLARQNLITTEDLSGGRRLMSFVAEELRRRAMSPRIPPREAIWPAIANWDLFRVDVARSHRGMVVGGLVTGTKRAVAEGLRPVHTRLLGSQRAFNQQLLEFSLQLINGRFAAGVGLSAYVKSTLEERMAATRKPHQAHLGVAARVIEPALVRQREWNRHATGLLVRLLEEERREATPDIHRTLGDLMMSGRVPIGRELKGVSKMAFPLWIELFRRQEQFNDAITRTLASLYGLPVSGDDGRAWYPESVLGHERRRQEEVAERLTSLDVRPLISLITPTYAADHRWLEECVASLQAQSYDRWEMCLVDDGTPNPETRRFVEALAERDPRIRVRCNKKNQGIALATNDCLAMATGDYVAFLDHDDTLAPHALGEVVLHLARHPETDMLFTDEDRLDGGERRVLPFFKPGWSPDLLRAVNYVCHFLVARRSLVEEVGRLRQGFDGAQDYDLVLRLSQRARRVGHVPEVLYHWRATPQSTASNVANKPKAAVNGMRALALHLERCGERGTVHSPAPTQYQIRYEVPKTVKAQLVVAGSGKVERLVSQLEKTDYARRDLCVVCHEQTSAARRLPWNGTFDLGAMYELARVDVPSDVYVFIHEDVELVHSEWLGELVAQALRPEIGVVGPKIVHPDSTIQDAGWLLNGQGELVRPFANMADAGEWTTMGSANWTRNYLAVSPACFAVRAEVLNRLGGFRAGLPGAGAVLDLCLRANDAGLRVLYTPHARVMHYAHAARPDEIHAGMVTQRRDPFFNPHLSRSHTNGTSRHLFEPLEEQQW